MLPWLGPARPLRTSGKRSKVIVLCAWFSECSLCGFLLKTSSQVLAV